MKKGGKLSLAIYIIYTLLGAAGLIYTRIAIEKAEGWGALGLAIILVLAIVFTAMGAVGLVLKLLHRGTGFGLFGFLCIIVDLAFIVCAVSLGLDNSGNALGGNIMLLLENLLTAAPVIIASIASLISNVRSLKN